MRNVPTDFGGTEKAMSAIVDQLAQAIARQEGYYNTTPSIAQRNNNPGNLRTWGNTPTANGYALFPTPEAGWEALRKQVQLNISRGLTLQQFFGGKPGVYPGYAPAADSNQPNVYAANVSQWTGIPVDVPLNALEGFQWDLDFSTGGGDYYDDSPSWWGQQSEVTQAVVAVSVAAVLGLAVSRV